MQSFQRFRRRSHGASLSPWSCAGRVAISLVRRRIPGHGPIPVVIDEHGTRIFADLSHPFGLSLFRYGFSEPEARLIRRLLQPGDVFIDGGAHLGVFTLLAAQTVGASGRVIACEPVPENLQLLRANVALNTFHWVETRAVALGEGISTTDLFSFGSASALGSFAPATLAGAERVSVDVTTLDELVRPIAERVSLVKLDIEGAEVLALRGAKELLRTTPDFLIEVEPDHLGRQGATVSELRGIFADTGYVGYRITQDERLEITLTPLATWRRPLRSPNIFVSTRPFEVLQRKLAPRDLGEPPTL